MNLRITLKMLKDCTVLVKEKSQFFELCFLMFFVSAGRTGEFLCTEHVWTDQKKIFRKAFCGE